MIPYLRVVTRGSVVWIDDAGLRYHRLPLEEQPRERAEWSDERAGPLQDAVWHPMSSWHLGSYPSHVGGGTTCMFETCEVCPGLVVVTESGVPLWFPGATVDQPSPRSSAPWGG